MESTRLSIDVRIAELRSRNRFTICIGRNLLVIERYAVDGQVADISADCKVIAVPDIRPRKLDSVIGLVSPIEHTTLVKTHALIR